MIELHQTEQMKSAAHLRRPWRGGVRRAVRRAAAVRWAAARRRRAWDHRPWGRPWRRPWVSWVSWPPWAPWLRASCAHASSWRRPCPWPSRRRPCPGRQSRRLGRRGRVPCPDAVAVVAAAAAAVAAAAGAAAGAGAVVAGGAATEQKQSVRPRPPISNEIAG